MSLHIDDRCVSAAKKICCTMHMLPRCGHMNSGCTILIIQIVIALVLPVGHLKYMQLFNINSFDAYYYMVL